MTNDFDSDAIEQDMDDLKESISQNDGHWIRRVDFENPAANPFVHNTDTMNGNGHHRSPSPLSPSRHFRGNGSALGLPSSTIRKTPGVKTVPVDAVMSSMAMEIEMAAINSSLPPGVQPRTGSNSSNDEVARVCGDRS